MNQTRPISVMLVDDEALMRQSLKQYFRSHQDVQVVGEAEDIAQAFGLCSGNHPDVVIVDWGAHEVSGLDAIKTFHARYPDTRIIVMANFISIKQQKQIAASTVVSRFLHTLTSSTDLLAAIRSVAK